MPNFLNKPYPFNDDLKRNAKVIFFISLSLFGFLMGFQPLDLDNISNEEKFYLIAGIGAITFLSLSVNVLVLPTLFPKMFKAADWTVWKEIIWDLWLLSTIAFGYLILNKILGLLTIDLVMIIKMLFTAVIPLTLLIGYNRNRLLKINLKVANSINEQLSQNKNVHDKLIHFDSSYQRDKLSIKPRLLVLIKSADNYVEVFWKDGDLINRQLIRSTLQKSGELLKDYAYIFKCHRSYIVNVNFIDRVEGNSQGNKLFFNGIDFSVPVSKMALEQLKQKIKLVTD